MKIYTEILGNLSAPEWSERAKNARKEYIDLDQWTAQKSRFVVKSDQSNEYAVALKRHSQLLNGDIIDYQPHENKIVAIRIQLSDVLVIDLSGLSREKPETIIHISVELGHAIGNQHWPAVVKGTKVYVPLTVDKKVMDCVMRTHHIEGISYSFQPGSEIIPYLAPHEIRRLFGGTGPDSDVHHHPENAHTHMHTHTYEHAHAHVDGHEHEHAQTGGHENMHTHPHTHSYGHEHEHEHADGQEHTHMHTHVH